MNKGQNVRRGRTRHTPKKGGSNSHNGTGNRVDSKSRGNPKQNLEKYLGMARDARQAGDRVNEENFLQFAEHFQRIINDRAQDSDDRRERSNNNNNRTQRNQGREHSSRGGNKPVDKAGVDPTEQEQPKIVDSGEATSNAASQDTVAGNEQEGDAPKTRQPRKRQPRAKAPEQAPVADAAPKAAPETTSAVDKKPAEPVAEEGEAAE